MSWAEIAGWVAYFVVGLIGAVGGQIITSSRGNDLVNEFYDHWQTCDICAPEANHYCNVGEEIILRHVNSW
jgi:hypothetical protein